ncbi:MAG: hypothetical protein P4L59_10800 [Desulfosporosinus sp.]|nr:hypothetical protein [Desulfosporosinus sp.]
MLVDWGVLGELGIGEAACLNQAALIVFIPSRLEIQSSTDVLLFREEPPVRAEKTNSRPPSFTVNEELAVLTQP